MQNFLYLCAQICVNGKKYGTGNIKQPHSSHVHSFAR